MKKMNRLHIHKLIILCATVLSMVSCDKFLDITPDGQVKRDEMLTTKEGIEDALYGVYAQMRQASLYGVELSFSGIEVLAQNLDCFGSTSVTALGTYDWQHSSVLSWGESTWTAMYKNISAANSVLSSEMVSNASAFPYSFYKGEALALRAFMHFDLVRLFAQQYTLNPKADGIPYQTEFSLHTPDFESLASNYAHIKADLKEAEQLLSAEDAHRNEISFTSDRQTHLNLHAVRAVLARVYLTMGDRDSALIYASKVIETAPYVLKEKTEVVDDLAGVLSQKECLFGIYSSTFYGSVYALLQQQTSYASLDPRDDFIDYYNREANGHDYRYDAYFTEIETGGEIHYRLSKFTDPYEQQNMSANRPSYLITGINLVRIPEMYYICAECLLEKDNARAMDYLNEVRTHRGLEPLSGAALTMDQINLERFKEYYGEGQAYFNYKRQNMSIPSADKTVTYSPSQGIYSLPIPTIENAYRY